MDAPPSGARMSKRMVNMTAGFLIRRTGVKVARSFDPNGQKVSTPRARVPPCMSSTTVWNCSIG